MDLFNTERDHRFFIGGEKKNWNKISATTGILLQNVYLLLNTKPMFIILQCVTYKHVSTAVVPQDTFQRSQNHPFEYSRLLTAAAVATWRHCDDRSDAASPRNSQPCFGMSITRWCLLDRGPNAVAPTTRENRRTLNRRRANMVHLDIDAVSLAPEKCQWMLMAMILQRC